MRYLVAAVALALSAVAPACGGSDDPQCKVDTDCSTHGDYECVAGECKPTIPSRATPAPDPGIYQMTDVGACVGDAYIYPYAVDRTASGCVATSADLTHWCCARFRGCPDGVVNGDEECDTEPGCGPDCRWTTRPE